jgi:hypothetical protein
MKNSYFTILIAVFINYSALAAENSKIVLPNASGEFAAPINDSRAAINAFSCAEIASNWKDDETVLKYLKIGNKRGEQFLAWIDKTPREKLEPVIMEVAGFWTTNLPAKAIGQDFYLGKVSGNVSSFVFNTYLKENHKKNKERLFSEYQCEKLK